MIEIFNGKDLLIKDTAAFIAKLNQQKKHHIGFCGIDPEEIENVMKEDVSEMAAATDNGKLIGWIGADAYDETAEVWGPFITAEYDIEIAFDMWEKLLKQIPASVRNFILFSNTKNKLVRDFAAKLQFEQRTDQTVLRFSKDQLEELPQFKLETLTETDHSTFIRMHDETFPGTYYSGKEVIERLNQHRKAFVLKNEGRLAGYAYVEAEPEYGDGSIEFIAVDPLLRGKGYGQMLLTGSVHWLFTFDSIDEIQLTVASENKNALGLYHSVGFEAEHELHSFVKRR